MAQPTPDEHLNQRVCDALREISDPPDAIVQIIAEHCGQGCPPNCVGVGAESTIF